MSDRASRWFPALVGIAVVLHVALVAAAGPGFMSSDDEVYARLANDLAHGTFELIPEHRANRLGLIAPTAAAYALLGVGLWTTVLWPLLWSCAGIVTVALVSREVAGARAGLVAAFLFAPLTLVVNGSAFLIPDGPVGVQMFAATACLWTARRREGTRAAAWGAAAALLVVVAVLVKLTVLWLAPLFAALFVRDVLRRRHLAAWCAFAVTGAVFAAVFFGWYAAATGDPLYRVHAVQAAHNDTHWAYENADASTLLARVTYEPALLLARTLPELTVLTALLAAALSGLRNAPRRRDVLLVAAHLAVACAGFWIGSTSLSRLAPLPLLPRMLAPCAAPLAVLSACALCGERLRGARLAAPLVVLGAAAAVVALDGRMLVAGTYAAAAAAALAALGGAGALRRAGVVAVLLLPVAMCGYSIARGGVGESRAMRAERRLVRNLAKETGPDALVVTDRRSERTFRFYRGYREAPPEVRDWDAIQPASSDAIPQFVYWHPARIEWRDGRMAPPEGLEQAVENGETVREVPGARLVRIGR